MTDEQLAKAYRAVLVLSRTMYLHLLESSTISDLAREEIEHDLEGVLEEIRIIDS